MSFGQHYTAGHPLAPLSKTTKTPMTQKLRRPNDQQPRLEYRLWSPQGLIKDPCHGVKLASVTSFSRPGYRSVIHCAALKQTSWERCVLHGKAPNHSGLKPKKCQGAVPMPDTSHGGQRASQSGAPLNNTIKLPSRGGRAGGRTGKANPKARREIGRAHV